MGTVRRAMVASALALPLAFGTAGIASADSGYDETTSWAGDGGAGTVSTQSYAGGHGEHHDGYGSFGTYFAESSSHAGPDGAMLEFTASGANAYGTTYTSGMYGAGEDGAWSSTVHSSANTEADYEEHEDEEYDED
ncbi:hypothetical protein [Amycolatopsis palatopharyngis]|uniref:hypothetical protein n=1 Tax=Amycolatopsis palatopharyngis TaxID=187982 RepID=UPI001B86DF3D|nr:hypothetical protein [Amycolatopsis palatopharyngis]